MKILEEVGLAEKLVPGAEVQEVWVNPRVWAGIPFDQKRKVAGYVSDYFNEKRTGGAIVIVKDNLTGRRLARLGPDGFTLD